MNIQNISAVIFDLDGTLIDSLPDLAASANRVRRLYQMQELPIEKIRNYIGDGMRTLIHRTLTDSRDGKNEELIEEALAEHAKYYSEHLLDKTVLFPNTENTVKSIIKKGLQVSLVTNKPEKNARKILEYFGIAELFTAIHGGDTLPKRKPNPDLLLLACEKMQVQPENTLMIGDSENDFLAARGANCKIIFANYGYGKKEYLPAEPDAEISDISELLQFI